MLIVAWRGGVEFGRENSIEAVKEAIKYADVVEVDVRATRDGKLVLHHDARYRRKKISASKYSELSLPLLEEALEIVTKKRSIMIDVKDKRIEDLVLKVIDGYDKERIVINSLQKDVLLRIRKRDSKVKLSVGFSRYANSVCYMKRVVRALNPWIITPHKDIADIARNVHARVVPWLIVDENDLKKVLSYSYGIVTPYPRRMRLLHEIFQ